MHNGQHTINALHDINVKDCIKKYNSKSARPISPMLPWGSHEWRIHYHQLSSHSPCLHLLTDRQFLADYHHLRHTQQKDLTVPLTSRHPHPVNSVCWCRMQMTVACHWHCVICAERRQASNYTNTKVTVTAEFDHEIILHYTFMT